MALELHVTVAVLNTDAANAEGEQTIVMRSQISSALVGDVDDQGVLPPGSLHALAGHRIAELIDWARQDIATQLQVGEANAKKAGAA